MRIDGSRNEGIEAGGQASPGKRPGEVVGEPAVVVNASAARASALAAHRASARSAFVREIKAKVDRGDYHVDSKRVAERMVDEHERGYHK